MSSRTGSPALSIHDVRAESAEHLVGAWTLNNTCITFRTWRKAFKRAHIVSREGVTAVIHSFSEYTFGFGRLLFVRPEEEADAAALRQCEHRKLGLALTMGSNNLYHQFFHAVPAFLTLLPHMREDAAFVPLVSFYAHRWIPEASNYSHAWEFSLRPFTTASSEKIMADTLRLLNTRCTCFDRIEGATGALSLYNPKALSRILAFCRQSLRVARKMPTPIRHTEGSQWQEGQGSVLYIRRMSIKRVLANDAHVSSALCRGDATGVTPQRRSWRAQCVYLEQLSLTMQIRAVAASNVMVGVHGQAMVWMPFMLSEHPHAAVVEILLPKSTDRMGSVSSPYMYQSVAKALNIHHTIVRGELAPGCNLKLDPLGCNLTVAVDPLLSAIDDSATQIKHLPIVNNSTPA